jgi:hypothetical protein
VKPTFDDIFLALAIWYSDSLNRLKYWMGWLVVDAKVIGDCLLNQDPMLGFFTLFTVIHIWQFKCAFDNHRNGPTNGFRNVA